MNNPHHTHICRYHLGRAPSEGSSPSSSSASLDALSLSSIYKQHFSSEVNPRNLGLLVASYMQRTDLALSREVAANGKPMLGSARSLRPPVLNMTGDRSPHVDATVALNGRLQPNRCTWMKLQGSLTTVQIKAFLVIQLLIFSGKVF